MFQGLQWTIPGDLRGKLYFLKIVFLIILGSSIGCLQSEMEPIPSKNIHLSFSWLDCEDLGLWYQVTNHEFRSRTSHVWCSLVTIQLLSFHRFEFDQDLRLWSWTRKTHQKCRNQTNQLQDDQLGFQPDWSNLLGWWCQGNHHCYQIESESCQA